MVRRYFPVTDHGRDCGFESHRGRHLLFAHLAAPLLPGMQPAFAPGRYGYRGGALCGAHSPMVAKTLVSKWGKHTRSRRLL